MAEKQLTKQQLISRSINKKFRKEIWNPFIKAVKDNMGNESIQGGTIVEIGGINYHRFGPYEFDNSSPLVTFTPLDVQ